jgi:hypothetical protein
LKQSPLSLPSKWTPAGVGVGGGVVVGVGVPGHGPGVSRVEFRVDGDEPAEVGETPTAATYLAAGNGTANQDGSPFTTTVAGDYFLTGVDVTTTGDPTTGAVGTVAVLGDQTSTAGAVGGSCGGEAAYACTWADDLASLPDNPVPGSVVNVSRAGSAPQNWWKLADGTGTTAADSSGSHPTTVTGGVTWSSTPVGSVAAAPCSTARPATWPRQAPL